MQEMCVHYQEAEMHFHRENTGVFKDSDCLTVVVCLIILSRRLLKKVLKIGLQDVPRRFQTTLPSHLPFGSVPMTGLERFWTPKSLLKEVHCVSPRSPKVSSFKRGLLESRQN